MSLPSAFRSPATTLSDFLRSLAVPRALYSSSTTSRQEQEWEVLRVRQGGTKRLDFFDHNIVGAEGAVIVLRAIEKSPGVTDVVLSHNQLGDDGLRELLVGLKRLRSRDIGAHLEELNLSDCGLSDVSLHLLALHLLQPSPHPPSIKALYLNHNNFSLGSGSSHTSLSEFLGSTLSSPTCSLQSLALTSNRAIGPSGLIPLLSSLKLSVGPSRLAELRLSVTSLTPECAEPLARWLEDPDGGARCQALSLNACALGQAGVRRIAQAVISGKASSLLHLEVLANEDGDDEQWAEVNSTLIAQEQDGAGEDWKEQLEMAKKRNTRVFEETRSAALGLLAKTRVLLGGNAQEGESGSPHVFPFLRLPIELQVHILRCSLLLKPSRQAHLYPPLSSSSSTTLLPSDDNALSSPLTEGQFLRLIAHCASRSTLETERRIASAHDAGQVPSLNQQIGGLPSRGDAEREKPSKNAGDGWEDWVLRTTGCDRFERAVTA
ncbi:hypothetical protein JCM11251_007121 [Rhodosporidiobolus azoricus]